MGRGGGDLVAAVDCAVVVVGAEEDGRDGRGGGGGGGGLGLGGVFGDGDGVLGLCSTTGALAAVAAGVATNGNIIVPAAAAGTEAAGTIAPGGADNGVDDTTGPDHAAINGGIGRVVTGGGVVALGCIVEVTSPNAPAPAPTPPPPPPPPPSAPAPPPPVELAGNGKVMGVIPDEPAALLIGFRDEVIAIGDAALDPTGDSRSRSHLGSRTLTSPLRSLASSTSSPHLGFTFKAFADPTTNKPWRARVRATFIRRTSARKPIPREPAARTVDTMMTSFSRPWKASTVLISTSSCQE